MLKTGLMDRYIILTGLIGHLATDQASHEASTRQAPHELTQTEKTKTTELPLKKNNVSVHGHRICVHSGQPA